MTRGENFRREHATRCRVEHRRTMTRHTRSPIVRTPSQARHTPRRKRAAHARLIGWTRARAKVIAAIENRRFAPQSATRGENDLFGVSSTARTTLAADFYIRRVGRWIACVKPRRPSRRMQRARARGAPTRGGKATSAKARDRTTMAPTASGWRWLVIRRVLCPVVESRQPCIDEPAGVPKPSITQEQPPPASSGYAAAAPTRRVRHANADRRRERSAATQAAENRIES